MPRRSTAGQLDTTDLVKTLRTAALVGAAAAATHLADNLDALDLGTWGPVIVPILAALLDLGRRWIKDNTAK